MSVTKGQLIGLISQLEDELRKLENVVNVCDASCVNFSRARMLCVDLKNALNGFGAWEPGDDDL